MSDQHLQLSALINIIIRTYFNNTLCIVHYHDDPINLVHLDSVPILIRQTTDSTKLILDQLHKCHNFLLQCGDARDAFESTEEFIKLTSYGWYNDRKYIVIIDDWLGFQDFFSSFILTFVREILVIYAPGENVDIVNGLIESNTSSNSQSNLDGKEQGRATQYKLFTHKYVGEEGNNDATLLDIYFTENQTFHYNSDLFPDKVTNQYGRQLRAPCYQAIPFALCVSETPEMPYGNEHNIVVKYAERFNMSLRLYTNLSFENVGYIALNWSGRGSLGRLIFENEEYADLVYGGYPWRPYVDMVKTVRYTYEVSVPLPNIKYGFLMFMEAFDVYVWVLILFLYLSTRALVYVHNKVILPVILKTLSAEKGTSQMRNISMYGMLLNQPATFTQDIRGSKFLKGIVILLLFSSVLLVTAYNSRLSSVMITPTLENNIDTLDDLAGSNLKLLFFDAYYWILAWDKRKVYRALFEKIVLIKNNTNYELSEEMLSSRKYAVARYRRINGEYFEDNEHLQQMQGKYKPITPKLFTNYYYILLRKNSMHTPEMERLIQQAGDAGLMKFWEEQALRLLDETTFQKQMQEYKIGSQNVNLNLLHLKGLFAFWGWGMFLSFLVFLKEVHNKRQMISTYDYNN